MTKYIFIKLLSLQTCASGTINEQMHTDAQSILTVLHGQALGVCALWFSFIYIIQNLPLLIN